MALGQYIPRTSRLPVMNGPFSSDAHTTFSSPGVSYGADAEIARKQRDLALSGLNDAIASARQRSLETPEIVQQRANIASHGTIEDPTAFKLRTDRETAAEMSDPSTALGRESALEHSHKMDTIHESNVVPAEIGARSRREIADVERQTALDASADRLAGSIYGTDQDLQAALEKDVAPFYDSDQAEFVKDPAKRDRAVQGFMAAVADLRRRYQQRAR